MRRAAEPFRMGKAVDDMKELDDRSGPAMRQHQGDVMGTRATLVQHMDVLAVDRGDDLGKTVDRRFLRAPIEAVQPVVAQRPHERDAGAGGPGVAAFFQHGHGVPGEVSDALVIHDRTREQRIEEEKLVGALSESVRLSTLRYQGGLDSYLQVLDAERNLFGGQLTLAQLRLQELQSVVQLYRALGGGWQ